MKNIEEQTVSFDLSKKLKGNWLSIRKTKDCLYGRRNGHSGMRVLGFSIRLRLFGSDII